MTLLLLMPWDLDMAATAAATPLQQGYLRGSLCGLLFRVQGTAPDWLSPGHMSKPCL